MRYVLVGGPDHGIECLPTKAIIAEEWEKLGMLHKMYGWNIMVSRKFMHSYSPKVGRKENQTAMQLNKFIGKWND